MPFDDHARDTRCVACKESGPNGRDPQMGDGEDAYIGICRLIWPRRPSFSLMRLPEYRRARDGHLKMVAHVAKRVDAAMIRRS